MAESLYLKGKLSIMPAAEPASLTSLQATENGDYTPPAGYDGFNEVNVNVPAIPAQLTNLTVTSNGDYTPPAGFDGFDEVNVNVPQSAARLTNLSATANGDYTPPTGYDGFDEVNVSVPIPTPQLTSLSVTANGDYTPPAGYDGFDEVNVSVPSGASIIFNEQNAKICDASGGITGWQEITTPLVSGKSYVVAIKDTTWHANNVYYGLFKKESSTDSLEMTIVDYTITLQFQANWLCLNSKSLSVNMDMFINVAEVVDNYADGLGGVSNE